MAGDIRPEDCWVRGRRGAPAGRRRAAGFGCGAWIYRHARARGGGASYTGDDAVGTAEDTAGAAGFHLRHGTTSTLASLVTAAPGELLAGVRALAEATQHGVIAGIHLEGPWLSAARCGAHDPMLMRDPNPDEIDAVLAAGGGAIRMVTLAPELPGCDAAIRRFLDAGVVVAVGHTNATYEQVRQAVDLGATVGTHLFNAMPRCTIASPDLRWRC